MDYSHEELVLSNDGSNTYNRSSSPQLLKLCESLKKRYSTTQCVVTTSGMNAISAVINGILRHHPTDKFNIIHADELYCDTPRLLSDFKQQFPNQITSVMSIDVTKTTMIQNIFEKQFPNENNILFIESCSNPNGYIFDFDIIPNLRTASKLLYVIVDNTWLTEVIFNPFAYSADFVVCSLTKYYSGGMCLGGAILGTHKLIMTNVFNWMRINGIHVSPFNCDLIDKNMLNMKDRITLSSELTSKVINKIIVHPKIKSLQHPILSNHPCKDLAVKYFNKSIISSVFTFSVETSRNNIVRILKKCTILDYKTSFGAKMSKIDPFPYKDGNLVVIRLSIGYDDEEDRIIKGIYEILNNI